MGDDENFHARRAEVMREALLRIADWDYRGSTAEDIASHGPHFDRPKGVRRVSQSRWRCHRCNTPWAGRKLMASPVVGDRCPCGGYLEQIAGAGWPDDLIGKRVGDNRA